MVAVIKSGYSVQRILNYNENKVREGAALCIGEGNFPVDVEDLSFAMKLEMFRKLVALRDSVKMNSVHISLNFDPSETNLGRREMLVIAESYMEKIGFADQPYLVYQHYDSGHPHLHIVTVKIRTDGTKIDMNNIGRNQSEEARKAIEKEFGLVRAEGRKYHDGFGLRPIPAGRIEYGRSQTKRAIGNVLENVLPVYAFSSLAELNAVLQLYNVRAERGTEESRVFKTGGLLYRILDRQGNPVGIPIKASSFYNAPTLAKLEEKFLLNRDRKNTGKSRIRNAVDIALAPQKITFADLQQKLSKHGIDMIARLSDEGKMYGVTYVDHTTKAVFNGSSLGKNYSAKSIADRCANVSGDRQNLQTHSATPNIAFQPSAVTRTEQTLNDNQRSSSGGTVGEALFHADPLSGFIPPQLKAKRKKKKKRTPPGNT